MLFKILLATCFIILHYTAAFTRYKLISNEPKTTTEENRLNNKFNVDKWKRLVKYYQQLMEADKFGNYTDEFMKKYIVSTSTDVSVFNNRSLMNYEYDYTILKDMYQVLSDHTNTCNGDFTSYVSVQKLAKRSTMEYKHICGGSLIGMNWVLTSEQCCDFDDLYRITAGMIRPFDEDYSKMFITENAQISTVDSFIVHKDICLMKLKENVYENSMVKYVTLKNSTYNIKCKEAMSILLLTSFDINVESQLRCFFVKELKTCNKSGSAYICGKTDGTIGKSDAGSPFMCSGLQFGVILHQEVEKNVDVRFVKIEPMFEWIESVAKTKYEMLERSVSNNSELISVKSRGQKVTGHFIYVFIALFVYVRLL